MAEVVDLEHARRPKIYRVRRKAHEDDYKKLHRFTKGHVEWISEEFIGFPTGERRGGALSPCQRMEITLRYLGDPGFQIGVALDFGVHQTTVSKVVTETLKRIVEKRNEWIRFPSSQAEVAKAKLSWLNKLGFPSTIGAIDCTHVKIEKPSGKLKESWQLKNIHPFTSPILYRDLR